MSRKFRRGFGIRFLRQCCGKTTFRRHHTWTVGVVAGATIDCRFCDTLLIIPREQFEGVGSDVVPFEVKMVDFHKYLNAQDPRWPKDGAGTGYVEF